MGLGRPHFVVIAIYTYVLLWLDGLGPAKLGQHALGAVTLLVLLAAARRLPPDERREMWFCVAFSTLVEVLATQVWGLYGYRLGNVPAYVPPGHGLIFLVAAHGARTEFMRAHGKAAVRVTIALATGLAGWGLVGAPRFGQPVDVHGALYWPFFVLFLWRSAKASVWAITFWVTTVLELVGVHFGTWHWASVMPGLGVPAGDPPSLIAGGYCSFALVGTWLAARTQRSKVGRTTAAGAIPFAGEHRRR